MQRMRIHIKISSHNTKLPAYKLEIIITQKKKKGTMLKVECK